jgi:CHAT domain-containing protein/Tfp pilus assembly protein PilF
MPGRFRRRIAALSRSAALAFVAVASVVAPCGRAAAAASEGVIVDEVHAGFGGEQAGLRKGDVLVEWARAASPPANPAPARGALRTPFDLVEIELEQAPRGDLTLAGTRDGQPLTVRMPLQDWVVSVRPPLDAAALAAYEEGRRLIDGGEAARGFALWRDLAGSFRAGSDGARASWLFLKLARFTTFQADWPTADAAFEEALTAASGDSAAQALILGFSAASMAERLDWAGAADGFARALALYRARSAASLTEARVLDQLGDVAFKHGDLDAAEQHLRAAHDIRQAAAPGSAAVANSLHNLGLVAAARGDLAAAQDDFERSLALTEGLAPGTLGVSLTLHNLGSVAEKRGDLAAAEDRYTRALAYWSQYQPESVGMASGMVSLANVSLKAGRLDVAGQLAPRAWELAERVVPGGIVSGEAALCLGDVGVAAGDLAAAEAWYAMSLRIRQAQQPGSGAEAEAYQRLAALKRRRGKPDESLPLYLKALDVLDRQTRTLGGTDEVRSRFAALYAPYYHETIDLLMELGRPEEAFHVSERYRARAFLALLSERDLVFSADVPEALDRERRTVRAEHDRAFAALAAATGPAGEEARKALDAVRRRQGEVEARIRAASPRLAALQQPEPLDLPAARAALDAGTLLLSYSIADSRGYLFAVGPGREDFRAVRMDVTLSKLRSDVGRFRRLLQTVSPLGTGPLRAMAAELGATLLGPVADRIARAERLLILPDGPLHLIPFAALADPSAPAGGRYLVEARPVHTAASATVFAEIARARRPKRTARLFALGDPDYGSVGAAAASRAVALRERGLELSPLPGSRREVQAIERLFPAGSRVLVGPEASEDQVRRIGRDPSLLHFACHALADAASPLDSSLVLALPAEWKPGQPNGLLQAWEILEQVRLDADLVALSACGTALGQEMSGEGVLGLTRAFQYAGARSVLASLWSVSDESTALLMGRFYRGLREGEAKDAALRNAQIEMLRGPRSHPALWAAFELSGDWK